MTHHMEYSDISPLQVNPRSHFKPIEPLSPTEVAVKFQSCQPFFNPEAMKEDILNLKEDELNKTKLELKEIRDERDILRHRVKELNDELKIIKLKQKEYKQKHANSALANQENFPKAKLAGKIKLRKTKEITSNGHKANNDTHRKKYSEKNVSSSVAEQLMSSLNDSSSVQEIINGVQNARTLSTKLQKQFEIELEVAHSQSDHLKSENNLLQITLHEVKEKYENLQMQLEKSQANNTGYQIALDYSEIALSLFKILLGKIAFEPGSERKNLDVNSNEMNNGVVSDELFFSQLLNCVPMLVQSHLSKEIDPKEILHLVKELTEGMTWDKFVWRNNNEQLLQESIETIILKIEASKMTCMPLELLSPDKRSHDSEFPVLPKKPVNECDFENAILLNELTAVKKELAEMKWKRHKKRKREKQRGTKNIKKYGFLHEQNLPEVDKKEENLSSTQTDTSAGSPLLNEGNIMTLADLRISQMAESEIGVELSQALEREKRLENHLESTSATLELVQHNSEVRHKKSQQVVEKLKVSYSALLENMKKLRNQHAQEISHLHASMNKLVNRHSDEIKRLKDEVLVLQRDKENSMLPDNETAL